MTKNPMQLLVNQNVPKIGKKTLKGSTYPYMIFHGDTWRKKVFFEESVKYFKDNDEEGLWQVVKKVWIDFNISTSSERVRMKNQGRLTTDYMLSLAHDNCPCCGSAMWYGRVHNMVSGYRKPSLDRLNTDGGYINQNVWIICNDCNTRKNNAKNPMELINIGLAWREQEILGLERYGEYMKDIPNLEKLFID